MNGISPGKTRAPALSQAADQRLIVHCLRGDEQAWSALIEKYKRLIYSIPLKYRASAEDAADIFQSVCIELFTELPRLRRTESLASWLITVTNRACLAWKRKQHSVRPAEAGDVQDPAYDRLASQVMEEAEREQRVRDAISRLPPRCQTMIRLLFFEQPSAPYEQVAGRLGLAVGSIGFVRRRCLKRLQRLLEEWNFQSER